MVNLTINEIVIPTGIEDKILDIVRIYPNPVDNRLKIELQDNVRVERVEFVDYSGKLYSPNGISRKDNNLTIFISNIKNGNYILNLVTEKGVNQAKVVIQR